MTDHYILRHKCVLYRDPEVTMAMKICTSSSGLWHDVVLWAGSSVLEGYHPQGGLSSKRQRK